MPKVHVRKSDTVVVISGKDRGKRGRGLEVLPKISKALVEKLSRIPMRVTGSESARNTAEAIANEFEKLGLDASLEEFETTSWEHGAARLTINGGMERKLDVQFMPFSPPVPEKGAKGKIVPLKFGFPKEYSNR